MKPVEVGVQNWTNRTEPQTQTGPLNRFEIPKNTSRPDTNVFVNGDHQTSGYSAEDRIFELV